MQKERAIEGVSIDEARAIKQAVRIPVISTGGYQSASYIREIIGNGSCDGVSIARSLVANNDLVKQWAAGKDQPDQPCTYCNKCLLNAPKNPMGCYELERFGGDYDAMIKELMSIYETRPLLQVPDGSETMRVGDEPAPREREMAA